MPDVKVKVNKLNLEFDLSEYPVEVTDYVLDQFLDELGGYGMKRIIDQFDYEYDAELSYINKKITLTNILLELIHKLIDEKVADIEHEEKHN